MKREKAQNMNRWKTRTPEEERFSEEIVKRSLDDLVAQVGDCGKKSKVGGSFEPEKEVERSIPFMVKIGGMWWEDGIGGVEVALREMGVEFCEGTK